MKLGKYKKYINSGIEWLGDIPNKWEVKRIKDVILKIGSGVTPKGGSETYVNKGITFLRSQNIYNDGLHIDDVSFISKEVNDKMKNSQIKPFDILINITGASIGRTCSIPLSVVKANINQHIIYLRIKNQKIEYLSYYLKSPFVQDYIMAVQAGTSKEALTMGQTLNIPLPYPANNEQTQIANYLDNKTQAIDKKINLLKQKIQKYKELRKSIINKAVTKGIGALSGVETSNVKFKDSGIDWIGDIPEHWKEKRVKDIFSISRGRAIAKTELKDNGKFPVYSSQTKNDGVLGFIETYDFNSDLLTWTTDGVNAGTIFRRKGKFNCTNICGTLTPINNSKTSLEFMVFAVQESTKHNKRIDTNGAKIMSNEMSVINTVFPPLEEQKQIAEYLDKKTNTIDNIIQNIEKQIETLSELRKTLINDVVTGKLRVFEPAENKVIE